ncbi:hypothetical protein EV192_111174 [Actinocrispum wychmicini]|uniref:Uncharacterized protein n=1 Tax=Actinocrispum wychmicini TaxID=1213861 RepID=A0A4V2S5Q8_9PSEU|nr:hypothetical protein EV192_111174 [Actinocrispum wychmicini]
MPNGKLRYAIVRLQKRVDGGVRLSELTRTERQLVKYCARYGYVTETPLKNDWLIDTGRRL